MKKVFLFIVITMLFTGCELGKHHLIGNYFILESQYEHNMKELNYELNESGDAIGVVLPHVTEVGFDSSFIIAKQKYGYMQMEPSDTISYFIIPLIKKIAESPDDNKIGPLTKEEFLFVRDTIGMSKDLNFSINTDNL